jgi:hypothetical protein
MLDGLVPLGINPRVLLQPTSGLSWVRSIYLAVVSFNKLLRCHFGPWSLFCVLQQHRLPTFPFLTLSNQIVMVTNSMFFYFHCAIDPFTWHHYYSLSFYHMHLGMNKRPSPASHYNPKNLLGQVAHVLVIFTWLGLSFICVYTAWTIYANDWFTVSVMKLGSFITFYPYAWLGLVAPEQLC